MATWLNEYVLNYYVVKQKWKEDLDKEREQITYLVATRLHCLAGTQTELVIDSSGVDSVRTKSSCERKHARGCCSYLNSWCSSW